MIALNHNGNTLFIPLSYTVGLIFLLNKYIVDTTL